MILWFAQGDVLLSWSSFDRQVWCSHIHPFFLDRLERLQCAFWTIEEGPHWLLRDFWVPSTYCSIAISSALAASLQLCTRNQENNEFDASSKDAAILHLTQHQRHFFIASIRWFAGCTHKNDKCVYNDLPVNLCLIDCLWLVSITC